MESTIYVPVEFRFLLEYMKELPFDDLRELKSEIDAILDTEIRQLETENKDGE